MCGDTGALINPGPNTDLKINRIEINNLSENLYIEKIWEREKNNCKINEKRDIELYKKFKNRLKNKIYTEREKEKMKENFIENEIDWTNEIKCDIRMTKTYTRIKNCRKNNILENWRKIEMEKIKELQNNEERITPNKDTNE